MADRDPAYSAEFARDAKAWRDERAKAEGNRPRRARTATPPSDDPLPIDAFHFVSPQNAYIYTPTNDLWPAASVDKRVPSINAVKASILIAAQRAVEQLTWAPGEDEVIVDKLVEPGGWKIHPGSKVYNLYRPPPLPVGGDPNKAQRWVEHIRRIYPETHGHIIRWFAHRVQHPHIKINHALVLGGDPCIGKDTVLAPVLRAVGYWNTDSVNPPTLLERFNAFLRTVILVISEARDMGEFNRYQFYEHMKTIIAAPPDTIRIDEKNLKAYSVPNLVGVIITTNHRDSLYLPADDRRHHCSWSDAKKDDFTPAYWTSMWNFYETGGFEHIAAYLRTLDVEDFNPKASPPVTRAFREIVNSTRSSEAADIADLLDDMGRPDAVTPAMLLLRASDDLRVWMTDRKSRFLLGKRLNDCDYLAVHNQDTSDGLWRIGGKRQVAYARRDLSEVERIAAVRRL